MDHEAITNVMTANGTIPIGVGITPNPYMEKCEEWKRASINAMAIIKISKKIESLFEPRFITPPETAQCIEALITMTDSRAVLELGTCTGFTTLHMLRALVGKPDARIVSIDCRPAHDSEFWKQFPILTHIADKTPECLKQLQGPFDFVFIDSDHTEEHTKAEFEELLKLTHENSVFVFHDVAKWHSPDNPNPHPARRWVLECKELRGLCLPTSNQLDCLDAWGPGYPKQCNPHLGVFMRVESQ